MNNTLISRLEGLSARFEEVSTLITDPSIISDMKRYVKLNKEYSELERIITKRNEYQRLLQNLAEAKEILDSERTKNIIEGFKNRICTEEFSSTPGLREGPVFPIKGGEEGLMSAALENDPV